MHTTNKNGAQSYRRMVQVLGLLEGLQLQDSSFTLLLDSGQRVHCLWLGGNVQSLASFFGQRVVVVGTAVWDINGGFYRIDTEAVRPGEGESRMWALLPGPFGESSLPVKIRSPTRAERLASMPPWPGDETDEELLAALKRLG